MPEVEIYVGELVAEGFPDLDADALRAATCAELSRLLFGDPPRGRVAGEEARLGRVVAAALRDELAPRVGRARRSQ